jgi:hypothetical protein
MALADHSLNLYSSQQLGDQSLVQFSLSAGAGDAARIAAESSPETSVDSGSHAGGVYVLSFPAGVNMLMLAADVLGSARSVTASLITVTNNVASITLTVSGGTILLSSERLHFAALVGRP